MSQVSHETSETIETTRLTSVQIIVKTAQKSPFYPCFHPKNAKNTAQKGLILGYFASKTVQKT